MQKKVPYVAQLGNMDCSIACMTMLFRYYGLDVDIVDVGQVVHIGRDGVNLTQLKQATQQFGFKCTACTTIKEREWCALYMECLQDVVGNRLVSVEQQVKQQTNRCCRNQVGQIVRSTEKFHSANTVEGKQRR